MSIFINSASKIIVQGMTGSEGTKHTRRMLASGSKVVGGVTPGKGVVQLALVLLFLLVEILYLISSRWLKNYLL